MTDCLSKHLQDEAEQQDPLIGADAGGSMSSRSEDVHMPTEEPQQLVGLPHSVQVGMRHLTPILSELHLCVRGAYKRGATDSAY